MADKYYGITGTAGLLVNYGLHNHQKMCVTDCIFEISDPLVKNDSSIQIFLLFTNVLHNL